MSLREKFPIGMLGIHFIVDLDTVLHHIVPLAVQVHLQHTDSRRYLFYVMPDSQRHPLENFCREPRNENQFLKLNIYNSFLIRPVKGTV